MSDKDFIHEVNEDVRTDKMLKLWRQYSRYFYAFVVTVLILVGGTSLLKNYRLNQSMDMANQYAAALELLVNRKYDDGLKALEAIEQDVTSRTVGYAVMAKLQRASFLLAQQKENAKPSEEALKIYWEISSNNDFPTVYRNIGTYLCAFHSLGQNYESIPRDEMLKRLEAMTQKDNASRLIALELLAHYEKIDGKIDEARKSCQVVINDTNNPETAIVDRCRALIATLPEVVAAPEAKPVEPAAPAAESASVSETEDKK
ncbi:MAG: hypothetical protein I8H80_01940 [Alphaproteobacteria bacterium]|nr:hypothetical protein [Alphaproteobacteria bacterium]